ncbi:MAG: hypothetical protein AOA65_1981 [Candidatus Bathyarchaeota archaeon BA1]|nr:MAG: hypothetical protein AOA65_1981 [Candidatus Bathyarchaeota archaeon BA1]
MFIHPNKGKVVIFRSSVVVVDETTMNTKNVRGLGLEPIAKG